MVRHRRLPSHRPPWARPGSRPRRRKRVCRLSASPRQSTGPATGWMSASSSSPFPSGPCGAGSEGPGVRTARHRPFPARSPHPRQPPPRRPPPKAHSPHLPEVLPPEATEVRNAASCLSPASLARMLTPTGKPLIQLIPKLCPPWAGQNSTPACALIPDRNGCLIRVISVTRSAASIRSSFAFRPVKTTWVRGGFSERRNSSTSARSR